MGAFRALARQSPGGLLISPGAALDDRFSLTVTRVNALGIPAIYPLGGFVTAGGLMSYGPDLTEYWRQTESRLYTPVAFAPGRLMLDTKPSRTGSSAAVQYGPRRTR